MFLVVLVSGVFISVDVLLIDSVFGSVFGCFGVCIVVIGFVGILMCCVS